jgi:hypothetical protein
MKKEPFSFERVIRKETSHTKEEHCPFRAMGHDASADALWASEAQKRPALSAAPRWPSAT